MKDKKNKHCKCKNPKPKHYTTELEEPYTLCSNCNKEIIN